MTGKSRRGETLWRWLPILGLGCALTAIGESPALADCDNFAPTSNQTVTCSPPPGTTGVVAAPGSTNVTVNIEVGGGITVTATGVVVRDQSRVDNQGAISTTGSDADGIRVQGSSNQITNSGAIQTTGSSADGIAVIGGVSTLFNSGTIVTTGPSSHGISAQDNATVTNSGAVTVNGANSRTISIVGLNGLMTNTGSLTQNGANGTTVFMQGNGGRLTNSGLIRATGNTAEAVFSNTLPGFTATIENLAGGRIISERGPAIRTLNGITTITNAGLIQSGTGVALNGGTSATSSITFILQSGSQIVGSVNGGNGINQVRLQGSGLVDNPFVRFQTLTMEGTDWTWNGTGDFANTFVNSGTLRLQSALSGQATVAAGATLEAGAQTLNLTVTNNGLVRFAQPDSGTYAGIIAGSGAVEKTGAGTTTLTGNNTYAGQTTIAAGTLRVGAGGTTGGLGTGAVTNNASLVFDRSDAVTIANTISGIGAVSQVGAGSTTLTGNNAYTGLTTIAAGTLRVGAGGTTGSLGTGAVTNNASLVFDRSDAVTIANTISGIGAVSQVGAGSTTLTGNNAYTGQTTISAGTLRVGAGGTAGSLGTGAVINNASLVFDRSDAVTVANAISGTGAVSQVGAGTTTLTGTNTYGGTTTISSGVLQVGDGGTAGTLGAGAVINNASLLFNRSNALVVANAISGTGSVSQIGLGTTTLTGSNAYSGGTNFNAGVLAVAADNALGASTGGLTFNGGTLRFNAGFDLSATRPMMLAAGGGSIDVQGFTTTISQAITGTGALTKLGSGSLILNGPSSFSGGAAVLAGTLAVGDAAHSAAALSGGGPIGISSGATLGGYGGVTGPVTNNGTIAAANALAAFAGGPTGGFTITGNLQNNGLVNLAGSGVGNSLTVIGNYVGGGGFLNLRSVLGGDGSPSDRLVVSVGSATGSTAIGVANAGGGGALTGGNGILVVQAINDATTAPGSFTLGRPLEAGAYSYLLFRGSTDSDGPQNWYLRSTLDCTIVPGAAGCANLLPNLRPAVPLYTAMPPLATQYGFSLLGNLHERLGIGRAGGTAGAIAQGDGGEEPAAAATGLQPYGVSGVWGRALGELGKRDNKNFQTSGPDYSWNFEGFQAGMDLFRIEDTDGSSQRAGLYGAIGRIGADVQRAFRELGPTAGSITMDAYSAGAYFTHFGPNGWYLDTVAQGTWYRAKASGVTGSALSTGGFGLAVSMEGGYPIALAQSFAIEPQAQLVYQFTRFDGGNDGVALVSFADARSLIGRAGARFVKRWNVGEEDKPRPLSVWLTTNVLHEFLDGPTTSFAGPSGGNAVAFGMPSAGTWMNFSVGASGAIGAGTTLFATASYQQNIDGQQQYAWSGRLGITQRW